MRVYPTFFKLAFSWMDAEKAHKIGFQAIRAVHKSGAGRVLARLTAPDASLRTEALGLMFPSPFGLAAGFDKEGHGIEALAELGFGLALDRCVVTGAADDLAWVSPKSGAAVSRAAGEGYADRLLPVPVFVREGGVAGWPDILAGLRLTGHFLERDLLTERRAETLAARARLVDRLKRAVA